MALGLFAGGLVVLVLSAWLITAGWGRAPGTLPYVVLLTLAVGLTVVLLPVAGRVEFRAAVWWIIWAAWGQAAGLLLTEAGTTLRYQHFRPWQALPGAPGDFLRLVLVLQAILVVGGLVRHREQISRFLRGTSKAAWVLFLLLWAGVSATVSRPITGYPLELLSAFAFQAVQGGCIALGLLALRSDHLAWLGRTTVSWVGRVRGEPSPLAAPGRAVLIAAMVSGVAAAALAVGIYQRHPHVPDEVSYLLQAATFASGNLADSVPPVVEAFEIYLHTVGPAGWYAVVPPGWPAVLALGSAVGAPWLVNPTLAGVNVLLTFLVLRGMFAPGVARLAAILVAVSPWHLFLGMSFMPHQLTLTCALLAVLGVQRARRTGGVLPIVLGGAALGWIGVTRQLDGLIVAIPLGLWALGLGGRRLRPGLVLALVVSAMAAAAPLLAYNARLTGRATTMPMTAYTDARFGPHANAYGFGPDRGTGWPLDPRPGHDLIDGMLNTELNLTALHTDAFGWSTGSLVLVLFLLTIGGLPRGADRLMAGFAGVVIAAYFANYFSGGPDFGARYWHLASVSLGVLTIRGLLQLVDRLSARGLGMEEALGAGAGAVALAALLALLLFVPWRAVDKYYHFRGMRPDVRTFRHQERFANALVLIAGASFPDFAAATLYNPRDLAHPPSNAPLFAWDRSPEVRARLRAAYPNRPVWLVDGPTVTGAGYLIRGPLDRRPSATTVPDRMGPS